MCEYSLPEPVCKVTFEHSMSFVCVSNVQRLRFFLHFQNGVNIVSFHLVVVVPIGLLHVENSDISMYIIDKDQNKWTH